MARLPIIGSGQGSWGDILNEFLTIEHNPDGTSKTSGSLEIFAPLEIRTQTVMKN